MAALVALGTLTPAGAQVPRPGFNEPPLQLRLEQELRRREQIRDAPTAPEPLLLPLERDLRGQQAFTPGTSEAVLRMIVNLEPKGDFLTLITKDGDVLLRQQDLAALGLADLPGPAVTIDGTAYLSLRGAAPRLQFTLDERQLELKVLVERDRGPRQVFTATPRRTYGAPLYPPAAGSFFNYNAFLSGNSREQAQTSGIAGELGAHSGEYLFLADGVLNRDDSAGTHATRLGTSVTLDRRESLQRATFGDFATPGDALGSPLRLGGVSFAKRYSFDPAVVRFPGQVFTGAATLPSELLLYSNGALVRRERIAPGSFELQNITPSAGLQVTELVVRDVLGNEQRIADPYYFSDTLLREGLDEYSVEGGAERRQYGIESNNYGPLGWSTSYRRGMTRSLTLGARGEGLADRLNVGPAATLGAGRLGLFSLSIAASDDAGRSGSGLFVGHSYQTPRFTSSLAWRAESHDYVRAATGSEALRRKHEVSGSFWLPLPGGTVLNLTLIDTRPCDSEVQRIASLTTRHALTRDVRVGITLRRTTGILAGNEVGLNVGITFDAFGDRPTLSATAQRLPHGDAQSLQLFGGNPVAEGLSYRVSWDRSQTENVSSEVFSPMVQYNAPRFTARGEYFDLGSQVPAAHQFNLAGGVASVGGYTRLTRPVTDSFAIVKVDGAAGIGIQASGIPVARTDQAGVALVPTVGSNFENVISVSGKDLPFGFLVPELRYFVVPAYRSGVYLDFQARRVRAIAGRLVRTVGERREPMQEVEVKWSAEGRSFELYAGRDGRFYVEDLPAGEYRLRAGAGDAACEFILTMPSSDDPVVDLGDVTCHAPD